MLLLAVVGEDIGLTSIHSVVHSDTCTYNRFIGICEAQLFTIPDAPDELLQRSFFRKSSYFAPRPKPPGIIKEACNESVLSE